MRLSSRAAGALVFLVSLTSCLLFTSAYQLPKVQNDAVEYLSLARNVAVGRGFTADGATPAVYRSPMFPILLGGWFRVTGTSSPSSAAVFQSLIHATGVLAAFLLFLEIAPSCAWALSGGLWLAVNPLLVTRVAFVLQEPTLLLFTTLAAWLSVRCIRATSTLRAGLAGASWGLCTLAKVVAWFAPFLLLAISFLPSRKRLEWGKKEAAALLLCFAAVIAPWTVRNYIHFHRIIPVNAQGEGMLLWNVTHAEVPGEPRGAEFVAEMRRKEPRVDERKALLRRYVLDHPRYFLVDRVVRNAIHFAAPSRGWWDSRDYFRPGEHRYGYWILVALFHAPLYLLLLLRSGQWWRGGASPTGIGFLILFYWMYWAEHALVWGDPRFGLAVYPILVGMALPYISGKGEGGTVSAERTP